MSKTLLLIACSGLLLTPAGFAQNEYFHHNTVTVGGRVGIPTGSSTDYLNSAPIFGVNYGYRLNRFLEANAGFQMAFGAVSNQNAEVTDVGTVQGGDHEYMIPLGGRVYIPTPFRRIEVSAGGGGIHLHYSETVPSNAGYYGDMRRFVTQARREADGEATDLRTSGTSSTVGTTSPSARRFNTFPHRRMARRWATSRKSRRPTTGRTSFSSWAQLLTDSAALITRQSGGNGAPCPE